MWERSGWLRGGDHRGSIWLGDLCSFIGLQRSFIGLRCFSCLCFSCLWSQAAPIPRLRMHRADGREVVVLVSDDLRSLCERIGFVTLHEDLSELFGCLAILLGIDEDVDVHCISNGLHLMFAPPFTVLGHVVHVLFVRGIGNPVRLLLGERFRGYSPLGS